MFPSILFRRPKLNGRFSQGRTLISSAFPLKRDEHAKEVIFFIMTIFVLENNVDENDSNLNIFIRRLRFKTTQNAVNATNAVYSLERRSGPFAAILTVAELIFRINQTENFEFSRSSFDCVLFTLVIFSGFDLAEYTTSVQHHDMF